MNGRVGADLGIGGVVAADAHTHTCTQLSLLVWIERESLSNLCIGTNQKLVISRISTSKHSHGPHITDTHAHSLTHIHMFCKKCGRFAVWFRNLPVYIQWKSSTSADFICISNVSITNLILIAAAFRDSDCIYWVMFKLELPPMWILIRQCIKQNEIRI